MAAISFNLLQYPASIDMDVRRANTDSDLFTSRTCFSHPNPPPKKNYRRTRGPPTPHILPKNNPGGMVKIILLQYTASIDLDVRRADIDCNLFTSRPCFIAKKKKKKKKKRNNFVILGNC